MRYAFPCNIEGNEADGDGFVVTFPDVDGAITGGFTFKESIILAEDCLVVSLGAYMDCQEELPVPSSWTEGQELIISPAPHRRPTGPLHRHASTRYHHRGLGGAVGSG